MQAVSFAAALLGAASVLSAADPVLLNLVMPDVQVLAGLNVTKAKTSSFGQFLLRKTPEGGDFSQFVNSSGFDPRRDLQEVLIATGPEWKHSLIAARGTFDAAKIVALALADGKHAAVQYSGAQLITSTPPSAAQAFALFDTNFAVAGDLEAVKGALDRRRTANPLNPQMAARVARYGASDAWTVSAGPLLKPAAAKNGAPENPLSGMMQLEMLNKIKEASGSVTFESPVKLTGELVAGTEQDAVALGDVARFLASMLQTQAGPEGEQAAALVKELSIVTQGNILKLALSVPEAQLESLIGSTAGRSAKESDIEKL